MAEKHENDLFDLGPVIKERAFEARRQRDGLPRGSLARELQSGRVIALNEVIAIMQQQAEGLGIPLADLRLDDIEPDRDFDLTVIGARPDRGLWIRQQDGDLCRCARRRSPMA